MAGRAGRARGRRSQFGVIASVEPWMDEEDVEHADQLYLRDDRRLFMEMLKLKKNVEEVR